MNRTRSSFRRNAGFTLIETVLALAIVGVMLISIIGLLGVAISANQGAVARTGAANVLSAIISDIRSVPVTSLATKSPIFGISLPSTQATANNPIYVSDDDQPLTTPAGATYTVNYWTTASTAQCQESMVRLVVSWPANAAYSDSPASNHSQGSVETVIFLDRIQ